MRLIRTTCAAALVLAVASLAACMADIGTEGTFDRTLKVDGPAQLEVTTGSGNVQIRQGTDGEVRIHGVIHARGWSSESSQDRLKEIETNPPVSQDTNLIRVGGIGRRHDNVSIDYTIVVPANTQLHSVAGSGDVDVSGIQGPANFTAGSGNITASSVGSDVQALAGSGDIHLSAIQGQTQATTGSGNIEVRGAKGSMRLHTGSGTLRISQPDDDVVAESGSGNISVSGARADLRVHTGSGDVSVDGNPGGSTYWDLHASSGNVTLQVPSGASFRLYARTSSGDIDAGIPIVLEGTTAKHELRARIGDGKGRVDVETSSGNIALR